MKRIETNALVVLGEDVIVLHFIHEANGEVGFRQPLVDAQSLSPASFALAEPRG
jgi:hypothetical protein